MPLFHNRSHIVHVGVPVSMYSTYTCPLALHTSKSIKSLYLAALHWPLCGKSRFYSTVAATVYDISSKVVFITFIFIFFRALFWISPLVFGCSVTRFESSSEKYCVNMWPHSGVSVDRLILCFQRKIVFDITVEY